MAVSKPGRVSPDPPARWRELFQLQLSLRSAPGEHIFSLLLSSLTVSSHLFPAPLFPPSVDMALVLSCKPNAITLLLKLLSATSVLRAEDQHLEHG